MKNRISERSDLCRMSCRNSQRGQALVETVVAALVLVPLFLLTPIIAKYIHAKQLAQQAVRSAAWEGTVVEDYRLSQLNVGMDDRHFQIVNRHFDAAGAPVFTDPPAEEIHPESRLGNIFLNTLTTGPLVRYGDIGIEEYEFSNGTSGMGMRLLTPGDTLSLVSSEVSIDFQNLTQGELMRPFDQLNLGLSARQSVLADSWSARGGGARENTAQSIHARSTLGQIGSLAPLEAAQVGGAVVNTVGLLPTVFPSPRRVARRFDQRVMEKTVDEVPQDRLRPYSVSP